MSNRMPLAVVLPWNSLPLRSQSFCVSRSSSGSYLAMPEEPAQHSMEDRHSRLDHHDADGSSHRLRSVAGPVHHGQGRRAVRRLGVVQARTQRALPNQALDCVDHKHGPNRKLDQIPVENPVSITGGSGSYPDR